MRLFNCGHKRRNRTSVVPGEGIIRRFRRLLGWFPKDGNDLLPQEYHDYLVEHILMRTEAHLKVIDEIAQQYLSSEEGFGTGRERENNSPKQLTQFQKREEQTW